MKFRGNSLFRNEFALVVAASLLVYHVRKSNKSPDWACDFVACKMMYELNVRGVGGWVLDLEQLAEDLCMSMPMLHSALEDFARMLAASDSSEIPADTINAALHPNIDSVESGMPIEVVADECQAMLRLATQSPG